MPSAVVIGAGQIGTAVALRLANDGWRVRVASRGAQPAALAGRVEAVGVDRDEPGALAAAVGDGADAVIDTVAYDDSDAAQLRALEGDVGAFVAISSASVYADDEGRSLDRSQGRGFPELPVGVTESQATVPPGPATYATRKRALELAMLDARVPAIVLRPCAVHGPHARDPREGWYIKRLLDGRDRIPLAFGGASRFHPSATANIAALVAAALARPEMAVLNAVDPDAPTVAAMGEAMMAATGRRAELVGVPGDPAGTVGATPWSVPHPFVLSDAAARAIGYAPMCGYGEGVRAACAWLVKQVPPDEWAAVLPGLAKYGYDLFDYAAEDCWLADR